MNIDIGFKIETPERIHKGKSLLDYDIENYCIIDIETTGLDSNVNEIIELGAIKIRNNSIVDKYQTLIKPDEKIDDFIENLTHITNDMVKNAPKLKDKLKEYFEFLGNDIIVGHNINFDINFLYDKCLECYNEPLIKNDFVDTLRLARRCIKDSKNHKLSTLSEKYKIDNQGEHRALADCIITFNLFNIEKNLITNNPECLITPKIHFRSKDISSTVETFNEENPFYQKECIFTGALDKMSRKDAMQIIANLGGKNGDRVTKTTNYLVLGNTDYCTNVKGNKTNKMKDAEKKKLKGQDIEIISENVFYDMIKNFVQ